MAPHSSSQVNTDGVVQEGTTRSGSAAPVEVWDETTTATSSTSSSREGSQTDLPSLIDRQRINGDHNITVGNTNKNLPNGGAHDDDDNDGHAASTTTQLQPQISPTTASKGSTSTTTTTKTATVAQPRKTSTVRSLKERSRVPLSFYVATACLVGSHYVIGFYSLETLINWKESMVHASYATRDGMVYLRNLMDDVWNGRITQWSEVLYAAILTFLVMSTLTLLIGAPLRAGFWTGSRTKKHIVHRYMGMAFLIQYAAAWVEYLTNYDHAKDSVLLHFIAINGLIQGYSAYFSFKVLPDLEDPGYFSDKAVISRKFVHENTYFSLITAWGSIYYNELWLDKIQSHPIGRILEVVFVFFAYVAIRPFFPTTHVGSAGTGKGSRTDANKSFYKYGTLAYKIFYLWAKYFLGFFINFLWMRRLCSPDEVKFIKGMYTLNLGTLSIGIFLHTLRFKGVLPGKLTFSIYLLQIYA